MSDKYLAKGVNKYGWIFWRRILWTAYGSWGSESAFPSSQYVFGYSPHERSLSRPDPESRMKGCRKLVIGRWPMTPFRGQLMLRRKIHRIFKRGRLMNFKLDIGMEYDDLHHWHAQWRQKRETDESLTSLCMSVMRVKEKSQKHQNCHEGSPCHGWYSSPVPRSKYQRWRSPGLSGWLFKSSLAGGMGTLWRPHYRPHSLFTTKWLRCWRISQRM